MKKLLLLSIAAISVALVSCAPEACIDISTNSASLGEEITMSDCSNRGGGDIDWEFGDGKTADDETVTHTYHTPGSYTITMNIESKNGRKEDETTETLTILAPDFSEVKGTWTGVKAEDFFSFFGSTDEGSSYAYDEVLSIISEDSAMLDDYGTTFKYHESDAEMTIGYNIYSIHKITNDELVLRNGQISGIYTLFYYER